MQARSIHDIRIDPSISGLPEVRRLVKLLDRIEYSARPTMRWEVRMMTALTYDYRHPVISFAAVFAVKDVIEPTKTVEVFSPVLEMRDEFDDEMLLHLIYRTILDFERHELDEHFYIDRIKVYDPHKETTNRR